jgi:hypothetical protein
MSGTDDDDDDDDDDDALIREGHRSSRFQRKKIHRRNE